MQMSSCRCSLATAMRAGRAPVDSNRKNKDLEAQINHLNGQLGAKESEAGQVQMLLQEVEQKCAGKDEQLDAARLAQDELRAQIKQLQEQVGEHERREAEAAAEKAAREAAEGPPPPPPEEVQRELLRAFDTAALALCREAAAKAGAALADGGGFCVGQEGFDSAAMVDAGLSTAAMAEQYLRAAMEAAVAATEPARLAAVDKWRHERRHRQQLQDQLQELKGSIRVMCRVRPPTAQEGAAVVGVTSDTALTL
eukprot:7343141-Prymnesium_polylepis.1